MSGFQVPEIKDLGAAGENMVEGARRRWVGS